MKIHLLIVVLSLMNLGFTPQKKTLKYIAVGDSYTIGEGAGHGESWPELLTKHLNEKGIATQLSANPSRTGWTSQMAIERELDVVEKIKPDFATLLIGVNDWVQGVDPVRFRSNLVFLIDQIQLNLTNKKNLLLVTIPDFSASPQGGQYGGGRDISAGIAEFNTIIKEEAKKRSLPVADIFEISKGMKNDHSLVASDGLHPSAKEYAIWEKIILPVAEGMVK